MVQPEEEFAHVALMDAGDASAQISEQSADKILGKVVVSVPDTVGNNKKTSKNKNKYWRNLKWHRIIFGRLNADTIITVAAIIVLIGGMKAKFLPTRCLR